MIMIIKLQTLFVWDCIIRGRRETQQTIRNKENVQQKKTKNTQSSF